MEVFLVGTYQSAEAATERRAHASRRCGGSPGLWRTQNAAWRTPQHSRHPVPQLGQSPGHPLRRPSTPLRFAQEIGDICLLLGRGWLRGAGDGYAAFCEDFLAPLGKLLSNYFGACSIDVG